jgi:hypothetical protein
MQKIFFILLTQTIFCLGTPALYKHEQKTAETMPDRFRVLVTKSYIASASEQFSLNNLKHMSSLYPEHSLIVFDLRREFHGFSNEKPVCWQTDEIEYSARGFQYNFELDPDQLEEAEDLLLKKEHCISEKQLVQNLNPSFQYIRLPILDHGIPSDEQVDFFLNELKEMPSNRWIHLHCAGGKGRAGVLLTMIDMLQEANHLSAQEIMNKHTALGASKLYVPLSKKAKPYEQKRSAFLCLFHKFCQETQENPSSWVSWLQKQEEVINF